MSTPLLLEALAPYLAWCVLVLLVLLQPVWILIGRQHPLRILNHALTGTFYLLVAGLLVPLAGAMTIIWWALAELMIAAVIIALARSRVVAPGEEAAPSRRTAADGAGSRRAGASGADGEAGASGECGGRPRRASRAERAQRRTVLRATRPSIVELVISAILAVGAAALMLIAG